MAVGNIYLIAAISIIGGGLFGFDISSMSAIIGTTQYKCYFNQGPKPASYKDCTGPKASVQGGITAAMPGGSFLGALCSGFLSDILGRRKAIMLGPVIWYAANPVAQFDVHFNILTQIGVWARSLSAPPKTLACL